jgi:hypothetical protein
MITRSQLRSRWWRICSGFYKIKDASTGKAIPFRPNPAQIWFLRNLHNKMVLLKSRQSGFSTLIQMLGLDTAVFVRNQTVGVVAHKVSAASTIMSSKIKFGYNNLPGLLLPDVTHSNNSQLKLNNGSEILIDTSLRSATLQFCHISELGKISVQRPELADEIRAGTLNTLAPTAFACVESTGEGIGGVLNEMVDDAKRYQAEGRTLTSMHWKFLFFGWYMEPRYSLNEGWDDVVIPAHLVDYFEELQIKHNIHLNPRQKAWYAIKSVEQKGKMKQEYPSTSDECFQSNVGGAFFTDEMLRVRQQRRIARIPHDPQLLVHTAWDIGMSNYTSVWFFQVYGREIRLIKYIQETGRGLPYWATELKKMSHEDGWVFGTHLGPHDTAVRDWSTGESRMDMAEELGLMFTPIPKIPDKALGIEVSRILLSRCVFDEVHTVDGVMCLDSYARKFDKLRGIYTETPNPDEYSHGYDAFEQLARGLHHITGTNLAEDNPLLESLGPRARRAYAATTNTTRADY